MEPPGLEPADIGGRLRLELAQAGVDVVHLAALSWYNSSIPDELGARIPARGTAGQDSLVVLIGNSRAVWEAFLEKYAGSSDLQAADNPLELYLERHVGRGLAVAAPGLRHRVYWSHRRTADLEPPAGGGEASAHVGLQRMAHHSGLAYLDHDSHLCLHPRFGPWFSLRAAVVFDDVRHTAPRPAELPHPLPLATQQYVRMALRAAVHSTSRKFSLPEVDVEAAEAALAEASMEPLLDCDSEEEQEGQESGEQRLRGARAGGSALSTAGSELCSGGSTPGASSGRSSPEPVEGGTPIPAAGPVPVPASAADAAASRCSPAGALPPSPPAPLGSVGSASSAVSRHSSADRESKPCMRAVAANWRAWVAVRDSPCPGHPMRYSEEQIEYHYSPAACKRDLLGRALLRRNLRAAPTGTAGLLEPALQAYHEATLRAQRQAATSSAAVRPSAALPITAS